MPEPSLPTSSRPVALVMGARRGLGRAIALSLADAGFDLVVNDLIDDEETAATLKGIAARRGGFRFLRHDIGEIDGHAAFVAEAAAVFGRIDYLVHNTGVQVPRRVGLLDVRADEFDHVVNIIMRGTFFLTQEVAHFMTANGGEDALLPRSIISITSANSVLASTDKAAYCVAKSALSMMSLLFALELGQHGIGVFDTLVRMMVGRELSNIYPAREPKIGEPLLVVDGLDNNVLHDVSLTLHSGEILGVCGLAGAGRSELLHALCGADEATARRFELSCQATNPTTPKDALAKGIGLLPEDRRHQGLFIDQSVAFNVAIARLGAIASHGALSRRAERRMVGGFIDRLRIKTAGLDEIVANLSGGNQQKCVLAKLLNANCMVLLVDEPTRGVDIGAKREIYQVLADLADREGVGIVMVSSELPEIIGLCDRVLVMRGGRITGEFTREGVSEEKIMHAATD